MHVCFPYRLNANTANTRHQALGECRAKGSGELKVEAEQLSSLVVLKEKQNYIFNLYYAVFLYK